MVKIGRLTSARRNGRTLNSTATLTSYATGRLYGSTEELGLTVPGIVSGVWNAAAASYNTSGTMGQKLNNAASGGVDYDALAAAVWQYIDRTLTANPGVTTAEIVAALEVVVLPVNVKQVNDVTVTGTGQAGDEWGP